MPKTNGTRKLRLVFACARFLKAPRKCKANGLEFHQFRMESLRACMYWLDILRNSYPAYEQKQTIQLDSMHTITRIRCASRSPCVFLHISPKWNFRRWWKIINRAHSHFGLCFALQSHTPLVLMRWGIQYCAFCSCVCVCVHTISESSWYSPPVDCDCFHVVNKDLFPLNCTTVALLW